MTATEPVDPHGERYPVDGRIVDGETHSEESFFTGDIAPVAGRAGDTVMAGALNIGGRVVIAATEQPATTRHCCARRAWSTPRNPDGSSRGGRLRGFARPPPADEPRLPGWRLLCRSPPLRRNRCCCAGGGRRATADRRLQVENACEAEFRGN
ncbi:MAG: hypothetical protein HXY30_19910 [Pseudorhodoplanes sp.]|nr:hypothetical protein [Pseudorhodoplanes sp.]